MFAQVSSALEAPDPGAQSISWVAFATAAVLTGNCWRSLRETIPEFATVEERNVVLVGVRDLEPYQRERVAASGLQVIPGTLDRSAFQAALEALGHRVRRAYLHVDLDSPDDSVGRANPYAADGGPDLDVKLEGS